MSTDNLLDLFDDNIPEEVLAWTTANSTFVTINGDEEEEKSGWDDQQVTPPAPLLPSNRKPKPLATHDQPQPRVRPASPPSSAFVVAQGSLLDRICTESKPVEQKSDNTTTKRWKERSRPPHLTEGSSGSRAYPHVMRPHKTIDDIVATSLIPPEDEKRQVPGGQKLAQTVTRSGVSAEGKDYDKFTGDNAVDPSLRPAQSALTTQCSIPRLNDSGGYEEPSDDTGQESFSSIHRGSTEDVAADGWDSPIGVSCNLPIGGPVRKVAFKDTPVDADSSEEAETLQSPNDYPNDWGEPPYDIPEAPESGTILRLGAHWLDIEPPMGCSSWAIYFRRNPTNEDLHRPEDESEEEEYKQESERAKNRRRTPSAFGARLEPHHASHRSRPPTTSASLWPSVSPCRHPPAIGSNSNTINLPFNRWEQNGMERVSQSGESQSDATAEADDEKLTIVWPEDVTSSAWDEPAEHPLVPHVQRPLSPVTTPQFNAPLTAEKGEEADGPSEVLQQMSKPETTSTKVHPIHQGFRVPTVPPVEGQILAQNFKSRIRPSPRVSQLGVRDEARDMIELLSSPPDVSPSGTDNLADQLTTADEPDQSRIKDILIEAVPPKGKTGTDSGIDLHAITCEPNPLSAISSVTSNSPRRLHTGEEPQQGHNEVKKVLPEEYFKNLGLLLDLEEGQHKSERGGSKGPEEAPLINSVDGDVELSLEVLIERSWAQRQELLAVMDKE